jgi:hypothetical protein
MAEQEKQEEKKTEAVAEKPTGQAATAEKPARVKASNCVVCNKVLKRGNWYYRNGKFFCTKRCWKKSTEKVA